MTAAGERSPDVPAAPAQDPTEARTGGLGQPGVRWHGDGALRRERAPLWGGSTTAAEAPAAEASPPTAGARRASWGKRETTVLDGVVLASFRRRALGWAVDIFIKVVLFVLVLSIAGIEPEVPATSLVLVTWSILSVGFDWIFFANGWTPGMRVARIRIVRADNGAAPGAWRGMVRAAGSVISQLPVGVGFVGVGHLWAAWDLRCQTWHDKAARTYVVVAPSAEQRPD